MQTQQDTLECELQAADTKYTWLLAEVQRVKRQHGKNKALFACKSAMDKWLVSRVVFCGEYAMQENTGYSMDSCAVNAPASTLGLYMDKEHEVWPRIVRTCDEIMADKKASTKIRKRVIRWLMFVMFADLKCGHLALRKTSMWEVPVALLGLQEAYSACTLFAMRVAYLREISLYRGGRGVTREIAMSTMYPLSDMQRLQFAEFRHGAIVGTYRLLTVPARIPGQRGLRSPDEFRKRLSYLTCGIFDEVKLRGAGYNAYLCGSCVSLAAMVCPFESTGYINKYYRANGTIQDNKECYVIGDSGSTDSDEEPADVRRDVGSRKKRSRRRVFRPFARAAPLLPPKHNAATWFATPITADIDIAVECPFDNFDAAVADLFEQIKKVRPAAILQKQTTENKHKYFVRGIERDVDLFHVNCAAYVVSKFHLDCVRCMFGPIENENEMGRVRHNEMGLLCHPSFVAAAHTSMNVGMRWSSNKKDPRVTVLKYLVRGWGTYLSMVDTFSIAQFVGNTNVVTIQDPLFANIGHFAAARMHDVAHHTTKKQYKKGFHLRKCKLAAHL